MHKFFKNNNKLDKGFTLVETLVAISIFTVSILGLISVLASGISDIGYAKKKIMATYLAQEGIEYLRNTRDAYVLYTSATSLNWNNFVNSVSPCMLNDRCGFDTPFLNTFEDSIHKCTGINNCKLYVNNSGGYDTNPAGMDSGFIREFWIDVVNVNEIKIFSTVSWTQGSGDYNVTFSEDLFNWAE